MVRPTVQGTNGQIQPTNTVLPSSSASVANSITSQNSTEMPKNEEDKLKPWVIIVISASAVVFLIMVVVCLLVCIFRRFV